MADGNDRLHLGRLSPGDVALLKNIAHEAAKETVREFATAMGIDPDEPFTAQQDMQWVRKTRERSEGMIGKVLMTGIGLGVVGAAHTMWAGLKTVFAAGGSMPGAH